MTNRMALIGLGMVPVGRRSVTRIPANVLAMVPRPTDSIKTVKSHGADAIKDTVPLMQDKIARTAWQVEKLAKHLQGKNRLETLRNDWEFIFRHIQYVKDPEGEEQVRSPRKLIYDGKGDCDCFTVALGALLTKQGIPFKIRVAAYNGSREVSHVYIVVPKSGSKTTTRADYFVLDPVVHRFDHEAPFTGKKDFSMKLTSLDGLSGQAFGAPCANGKKPVRRFVQTQYLERLGFVPTAQFLRESNISYREATNSDQQGVVVVDTANGPLTLPTVMDKPQSVAAMAAITAPKQVTASAPGALIQPDKILASMKEYSGWWLAGLGAAGYWLFTAK